MKIMKSVFLTVGIILLTATLCLGKTINVGTDRSRWYPFTYMDKGQSAGMHVDIAKEALKNLGYNAVFSPTPWDLCLSKTAQGTFDALVSGSYKPARAEILLYPPDAGTAKKSEWRIMQVEYILVTASEDPYVFDGNIKTLPEPIRAPRGYSIVDDLRGENIKVITNSTERNLKSVASLKKGGVVTIPGNARMLIDRLGLKGQLKIHEIPIKSKSYFMVFSKKTSNLTQEEIMKIWEEIARLRDDAAFMEKIQMLYE